MHTRVGSTVNLQPPSRYPAIRLMPVLVLLFACLWVVVLYYFLQSTFPSYTNNIVEYTRSNDTGLWRNTYLSKKCNPTVRKYNYSEIFPCEQALKCGKGAHCYTNATHTRCLCDDHFRGDGCTCDDPAVACAPFSDDLTDVCDFRVAYSGSIGNCPPHSYLFKSLPMYSCSVWNARIKGKKTNQREIMPRCICEKGFHGYPDDGIACVPERKLRQMECVPPEMVLSRRALRAYRKGISQMLTIDYDKRWREFLSFVESLGDEIVVTKRYLLEKGCDPAEVESLHLPDTMPNHSLGRCAFVSSSSLLTGSGLGSYIDGFDKVIRSNRQIVSQNRTGDVGRKFDYRVVRTGRPYVNDTNFKRKTVVLSVGNEVYIDHSCSDIINTLKSYPIYPIKHPFVHYSHNLLPRGFSSSGLIGLTTVMSLCNVTAAFCFNGMDFDSIAMFTPWYLPHHYDCNRGMANVFNAYYVMDALEKDEYTHMHPFWYELGWLWYWEDKGILRRECPKTPYDLPRLCLT